MIKMNKKGFTLIEMLVVIAIIAILVAIIVPTISHATEKAAAATNAANLRSVKAEATTNYLLTGSVGETSKPLSKKVSSLGIEAGLEPNVSLNENTGVITVTYGEKTIDNFAVAAGGTSVGSGSGSGSGTHVHEWQKANNDKGTYTHTCKGCTDTVVHFTNGSVVCTLNPCPGFNY